MLRYRLDGCSRLVISPHAGSGRADELWKTTCFELFLGDQSPAYFEFNFSPSGQWAAYGFGSYRGVAMQPELALHPQVRVAQGPEIFVLTAFLASDDIRGATRLGVSAVVEEQDSRKSYWALSHPDGKPDFHDPTCFAAKPL